MSKSLKVWIKEKVEDKILASIVLEGVNLYMILQEFADKFDISTPIILSSHLELFERFNRVEFLPRDFIYDIPFTALEVERVD